jgi:TRAP-type mannitol/chloroaromatic compound transport system permease large subunit
MEYIILFGLLFVLLAIGVPVAFSLLAATLATVLYLALPPIVVFQQMGSDITSVALLAIPLFVFTGELMLKGGLSDRMIALASSLVGHMRGGLGQVTVVGSTLFGGVSGSAIADVSAVGGTMIPQMQKRGYDADYAVNVTISAALVALFAPYCQGAAGPAALEQGLQLLAQGSLQGQRPIRPAGQRPFVLQWQPGVAPLVGRLGGPVVVTPTP